MNVRGEKLLKNKREEIKEGIMTGRVTVGYRKIKQTFRGRENLCQYYPYN